MNQLTFNFKATECNGWPMAQILVDNDILQEFVVVDKASVTIDLDYLDGNHLLEIERFNKTNDNIVVVNGEILQDQTIELTDIFYNDIRLPDFFLYHGKFCWDNNDHPGILVWGPNGVWKWEFSMPFITWAVDSLNRHDHPDMVIPHRDNVNVLKRKIHNLKKIWQ